MDKQSNTRGDSSAVRRAKLAAVMLAGVISAYSLLSNAQTTQAEQAQQPTTRVEVVGMQVPMDQRTGKDDGAAFAVHFSGETHGSLEACG